VIIQYGSVREQLLTDQCNKLPGKFTGGPVEALILEGHYGPGSVIIIQARDGVSFDFLLL
jgi:hypothetical protein